MEEKLSLDMSALNQKYNCQINSIENFFTKQIEQLSEKFNLTHNLSNQMAWCENQSNQGTQQHEIKINKTNNSNNSNSFRCESSFIF